MLKTKALLGMQKKVETETIRSKVFWSVETKNFDLPSMVEDYKMHITLKTNTPGRAPVRGECFR